MLAYVALVVAVCNEYVRAQKNNLQEQLNYSIESVKNLIGLKESYHRQKLNLQEDSLKIFTLYEMTKDITRTLHKEEAFKVFKQKLTEHVLYKDCRLLQNDSEEIKKAREENRFFIFPLKAEKATLGYLVLDGLPEGVLEKVVILGHQFALALRRVTLYEEIEKIAIRDSLTDVYTRRYFFERLQDELERSKVRKMKMSLLMIDVDFFKKINDQYGHLAGDQILKSMANIIKENIREIDIAGRYGGEEFCVVLPDTDLDGARYAAHRILLATSQSTIKAYDTVVEVTVSIGVSTFPQDAKSMNELIEKADQSLYQAKHKGRNRVEVYSSK